MKKSIVTAASAAALLAAPILGPAFAQESDLTASAQLQGPNGEQMGTVNLIQGPHGVLVTVDASGLAPGGHGFHIHETGECQGPDFTSAGDHYMPNGQGHGFLADDGPHAGDMPNIHAGADGMARADHFAMMVSLAEDAPNTVFDADGSAVIVHERMDSYGDEANAGGRVACGVITPGT